MFFLLNKALLNLNKNLFFLTSHVIIVFFVLYHLQMNFFFFIETLKSSKRYNLFVEQNNKLFKEILYGK